jgi:hypothetical protein
MVSNLNTAKVKPKMHATPVSVYELDIEIDAVLNPRFEQSAADNYAHPLRCISM